MAYLFDTDVVSEVLRPKPRPRFLEWLRRIPREDQYISAVTVGELYHGAYRSAARERHPTNIEELVLPAVTVLPYDASVARIWANSVLIWSKRAPAWTMRTSRSPAQRCIMDSNW